MSNFVHVFFGDEIGAGGISTNIIALAQYLAETGRRPIIVPIRNRKYEIWNFCGTFSDILTPSRVFARLWKSEDEYFIFFANSVRTLILSYLYFIILGFQGKKIKIVFAVYNPWEFCQKGAWQNSYREMIYALGKENIYFMNGACFEHHQLTAKFFEFDKNYLPLVKPSLQKNCSDNNFRSINVILTVGRFVGFKMHYLRELILYASANPELIVNIVGYGDGDSELRKLASDKKAINVNFLGMIEYEALIDLYATASCFVGMGTTLVEASSYGTPSVVAIAGLAGNVSYGFFTDQLEYDMGEYRPTKCVTALSDVLDDFFKSNLEHRQNLSVNHKVFSDSFSLDKIGKTYCTLVEQSSVNSRKLKHLIVYTVFAVSTVFYFIRWKFTGKTSRYDVPYC